VSGTTKPSAAEVAAFEEAVAEVAATTERLLGAREGEQAKARLKWARRVERISR
jgi:hypothetical protein